MIERLDPTIEALLQAARAAYAASLPSKIGLLDGWVTENAWRDARRSAHRLRGSATTYGFDALGALASEIEELLIEAGDAPDAVSRERLSGKLRDVRLEAERAFRETR